MDYNSAEYGVSKQGVYNLLLDIKGELITKVANECKNIDEIKKACEENWHGTSCDNFIMNLIKDTGKLEESLNELYNALGTEVISVAKAMLDFDQNLIENNWMGDVLKWQ